MRKLHWYEGLPGQRLSWLDLLRWVIEVIVVRYDGPPARPERRRRHCLERQAHELEERDVRSVTLESRGQHADRGDRVMIDALRTRGVGRALRWEHSRGAEEPLLALADIACGAFIAGTATSRGTVEIVVG